MTIFVDFINERKKQYKDRNGYDSVILLFHSSNPSHTIFLCKCCTNTIAFKNPKAAFIEFELLKVQSKRGNIELFLTQVS